MSKINLNEEIRQTYFIMFEENGIRYIFNRSIPWNSILSTKNISKLIDVLGKDAINNFILRLNDTENDLVDNVNYLTNTFILDTKVFKIIEVHPEWENYNREHQWEYIEPRKDELCKKYNAVKRKDKIGDNIEIDKQIGSILKREFKKWLIEIYNAIIEYAHVVNDAIVRTTLGATLETLKQQIEYLRKEKEQLCNVINSQNVEIRDNKKTLRKQNYVIDAYNRYINKLDDESIAELRKSILNSNKYYEKSYCF